MSAIPYPPVFRDWQHPERRVATASGVAGVQVQMYQPESNTWRTVELTEDGATLLAASLLQRAGHQKLSERVARKAVS